jgi:hypothetical protein
MRTVLRADGRKRIPLRPADRRRTTAAVAPVSR